MQTIPEFAAILAKELLKAELKVEEENEGFAAGDFFFSETDEKVEKLTIRGKTKIGNKWRVETIVVSGGSYWCPPDEDIVEILIADSLEEAIIKTAVWEKEQEIKNRVDALGEAYWYKQNKFEETY